MQLLVRWTIIRGLSSRLKVSTARIKSGHKGFRLFIVHKRSKIARFCICTYATRSWVGRRTEIDLHDARSVRISNEGGPGKYLQYHHTICNNRNGYYRYYLMNPALYYVRELEWRRRSLSKAKMVTRNKYNLPRSCIIVTSVVSQSC